MQHPNRFRAHIAAPWARAFAMARMLDEFDALPRRPLGDPRRTALSSAVSFALLSALEVTPCL